MYFQPLSKNHEKWIRKLHKKKYRHEEKVFIGEGLNAVRAALEHDTHAVKEIVVDQNFAESISQKKVNINLPHGISLFKCSEKIFKTISSEETPQGILTICRQKEFVFPQFKKSPSEVILYLEGISDPGNLGTIIRTAAWFGIKQVLMSPLCVDALNPKVVRGSAGTIFDIEIYQHIEQSQLYSFAEENEYKLIATVPHGGTPIDKWNEKGNYVILLGQEASGLSEDLIHHADHRISIPGEGNVESLNLAIATAIILYEISYKSAPGN